MSYTLLHESQTVNENLSRGLDDRQFRIHQAREYLKRTQYLFEHFGSTELKSTHGRFEELQNALATDRVNLVVLGEFSRGKSELLNALLGIELLQTAQETTTAVNTFLQAIPVERDERFIRIHYQDNRPAEEISWHDDEALMRWGTELEKSNSDARREVSHIEVFHDHDLLKKGLVLIDTPGLKTIIKHHEEITHRAIAEAHVALWVQATDQLGGTESEWEFMARTLRRNFQKFITVINKWDKVLEPQDASDRRLSEEERVKHKLQIVKESFQKSLGGQHSAEISRLTDENHLFGVSARWARDPDPMRRERSNIKRLSERIVEMLTSGEAQEQVFLKPLKQLTEIQSQLEDYITHELNQIDTDKSAEIRDQELQRLDLDIRELEQKEERETRESHDEHQRVARVVIDDIREQLLKPLISLRDSIDDQVTESYVRRMMGVQKEKIGLPSQLDQQYQDLAFQLEVRWREQKGKLNETLYGLREHYLDAMTQHGQLIETSLSQLNIALPQLELNLDFDFSGLEDHRRRSAELNNELESLKDEIDSLEADIANNTIDEQKRLRAEAEVLRVQRRLESMGAPPAPVIYEERRKTSDYGSGFLWLSPTYETVTCKDDNNVKRYERELDELNELHSKREQALGALMQEEFERTGRKINLEAARKKLDRQMAKREKDLQKIEHKVRQDEEALIEDTVNRLRRNTLNQLNTSIAEIDHYLTHNLRQVFMEQAMILANCVQEQMLEPLNAKRAQQQEIEMLLQQSQNDIAVRSDELTGALRALVEVQKLTQFALQNA
ncbi:dynamin family protein [Halomonas qinghailakensis]|uniref:Dynamin family protein n=1 Tax=Halomonas qinghailakensis TaxID=2937790 RepID=A0AA46YN33_9GAMM|nr:dynamin family protein [Halomonas sp. ZZQ-149]UYO73929.1 dynamin family protein [Halomonas sp. ZZQ-149]